MPIEHSLSPVLHTAAYAELGLSGWDYRRYAVDEAGLPGFVAGLGPEWVGLSLTMPLKRVALEVADEVAPDTAAIGAANTLVRAAAGWLATNTDVVGIEQALRAVGVPRSGAPWSSVRAAPRRPHWRRCAGSARPRRRCSCATRPGPVRCATPPSASA